MSDRPDRRGPSGDRPQSGRPMGDRPDHRGMGEERGTARPWDRSRVADTRSAGGAEEPVRGDRLHVEGPLNARSWALAALRRIEEDRAYVARLEPDAGLGPGARRTATDYVAGVTRWRRWLDHLIDATFSGQPENLDQRARQVLRLGIYELLYASTPPHAAVHAAVSLAKDVGAEKAMGLVNAVLRNLDNRRDDLPQPATGDPLEDLAIRHSHPSWLVKRWRDRFGIDQLTALLNWNNARPSHGLRVNRLRTTVADVAGELAELEAPQEPSTWLPDDLIRVTRLQPVLAAGLLTRGLCVVQDEAAALVVRVLDPQRGESIIDVCAAPGGKATYAAELMKDRGQVLALDVHPGKVKLIEAAAARLGLKSVRCAVADLLSLHELRDESGQPLARQADRVLLDAPCSGTGVMARRADLRWNREPGDLATLCKTQDAMLDAAAALVRPDGLLVYSTCSLEPEENEARVDAFLERHPDFGLESAAGLIPADLVDERGFYRSLPQRHGIDGGFAARLRRNRMVARR